MQPSSLRQRLFLILESDRGGDRWSRLCDLSLVALILANVVAAILETVPELAERHAALFTAFERASFAVFSVEYLLRLWTCTVSPPHEHPLHGRLAFAASPLMLIDLGVLALSFVGDLRTLRVLRLVRLARYSARLRLLGHVVRDKREELAITFSIAIAMLVLCATAMYWVEHGDNPAFGSIPETMWWGVATLTTVGYGDVYPLTPLGKVLGAVVALIGVGMFALPAGILAGGFSEALEARKRAARAALHQGRCPHCGESL